MKNKFIYAIIAIATLACQPVLGQTLKTPAPSPTQTLKQNFGLSEITLEYSRPGAKDRTVFGELVPFGKVWRTGANASTKITFADAVTIGGKLVEPGTYAIYTIPNKLNWEVMLYKDLKMGGNVNDYNKKDELLRTTVTPSRLSETVETFTMNFDNITSNTCELMFTWENTRAAVPISTDIETTIMKNIETVMNTDSKPYYQAATYYYQNDKDPKKALEWANLAVAQNPKAFWVQMLKARIEAKNGDKKAAIASANKVITLATEAKNDDYVTMAKDLISSQK